MGHDLRAMYGGCYRRLASCAYALTGDVAEAEACVQAAFVEAIGARLRFNHQDDPEAWLRSAALRIAQRRHRGGGIPNDSTPPADGPNPTANAVLTATRSLAHGDREVAALGVVAELPASQIATLTGSSASRVDTRLARSRKHLAEVDFGLPLAAAVRETRIWVEQTVDPPPFDSLQHVARHRRRRRLLAGAAGVVVLVAAAISVPVVVQEHRPGPLVPVTQIKFSDHNHGYALIQPCSHGSCSLRIARTADGGQSWSEIDVPHGGLRGMSSGVALGVCCQNRLSLSYSRVATAAERARHVATSNGMIRIHAVSHDGGTHWNSSRDASNGLRIGQQTEVVPPGWLPLTDYGMSKPTVVAVNTVDDVERPLRSQPDLITPDVSVPFRPGDRIWATGGLARDQLAYSDDQGRSWHQLAAPKLRTGEAISTLFPRPGKSVYLQTRLDGGKISGPTWRLNTSGNWTQLPGFGLSDDAVASMTLPDGELWISGAKSAAWRTAAGGTRVVGVHGPQLDGKVVQLSLAGVTPDGALYALEPQGGRQDVFFSSRDDGQHWTVHDIRLPRSSDP